MNRGSGSAMTALATSQSGFNEAPIHESGKWSSRIESKAREF